MSNTYTCKVCKKAQETAEGIYSIKTTQMCVFHATLTKLKMEKALQELDVDLPAEEEALVLKMYAREKLNLSI